MDVTSNLEPEHHMPHSHSLPYAHHSQQARFSRVAYTRLRPEGMPPGLCCGPGDTEFKGAVDVAMTRTEVAAADSARQRNCKLNSVHRSLPAVVSIGSGSGVRAPSPKVALSGPRAR